MADESNVAREQLDALRSLPLDDSSEEKVDALWRQILVYKSFAETDLSEAKARRAQAEAAREQAQMESVRATQLQCARMRTEAESALRDASSIRAEAAKVRQQMESELEKARQKKIQAEVEGEQIVADAQTKAEEIIQGAQEVAKRETTELRRHALQEIKTVLNRVESMRNAASEELETQRILTNISKIKANSRWLMSDNSVETPYPDASDGSWSVNAEWQSYAQAAQDDNNQPAKAPQSSKSYSEPAPKKSSSRKKTSGKR